MLKIGVLVSGGGTNLQAVIDGIKSGYIQNCEIATIVSNRHGIYSLERAKKYDIPSKVITRKDYGSMEEYDDALVKHFTELEVELVVMAGFLSILGERFIKRFEGRIINVHPSLIPAFCGKGYYGIIPHQKALEYGVKVTGATVHFVELDADTGPIILQKAVEISSEDTPESIQKKVMEEVEWKILPEAIKLFAEGKIRVEGRKVRIEE